MDLESEEDIEKPEMVEEEAEADRNDLFDQFLI